MPFVAVPDKNAGDVFSLAMWTTYLEGNINTGVNRPLADQILGSTQSTITMSSIPQTFAHLRLVLQARDTQAVASLNALLRFNGDSGANYDAQYVAGSAAVASAAESLAATSIQFAIPGASAGAGLFGATVIDIAQYAGTTGHKCAVMLSALKTGTATGNLTAAARVGFWRSTAAINQITLSAGTAFDIGSRFTLYGLAYI